MGYSDICVRKHKQVEELMQKQHTSLIAMDKIKKSVSLSSRIEKRDLKRNKSLKELLPKFRLTRPLIFVKQKSPVNCKQY